MCGIFTGHITKWDNAELTAANGGVPLGTGTIKVLHRTDGSGTNFIFTNSLYRQCEGITGPNNETDSTTRSWQFRFSDRTNAACPDQLYRASNTTNWPDLINDSCTPAVALNNNPGGGTFVGVNGNGGMKSTLTSTNGTIGYTTTDYAQPVLATGPLPANLQSQFDFDNNTGAFQWASPARITNAMAAASLIFPTPEARANPLNWSSQGQVPNPGTPDSYPIAGFTWIDMYQCYAPTRSGGGTLSNFLNYLGFHYYDEHASQIIAANGFAAIPQAWRDQLVPLMTGGPSAVGSGGDPSVPGCATRSGA
jgi:ABC-type phosphate transport system substrate-binding protein